MATTQGQPFGTIQSVSGSARIIGIDGSARSVVVGGKIFNNEMILTTANAAVKIQLGDGQIVDIGGGSEYQVGVDGAGASAAASEQGGAPGAGPTAGVATEGSSGGRVIGTITGVTGEVKATAPDGSVRVLGIGDRVFANETVVSSAAGPVNIALTGGGTLECAPGAELLLNPALLAVGRPTGLTALQEAILAGADPSQVADPTAAGAPAAGGSEEGAGGSHVIVVIEQANSSSTVSAGFATFGAGIGFPTFQFELLPRGVTPPIATLVGAAGPGVPEGTNGDSPHIIQFIIQLNKAVPVAVGVNYLIVPPAADGNGPDLAGAIAGTVIIPAGQTSAIINISVVQDHFVELNEQVTIQLTDAINATINPAANSATITVLDDDFPPIAVNDTFTIDEGQPLSGSVLPNDTAQGPEQLVVITAGTFATTAGGTVVLGANGNFTYTPPSADFNGSDSFNYTIRETENGTLINGPSTATVSINVLPVNDPPVLEPVAVTGTVFEAGLATDTRPADPDLLHTGGAFTIEDLDGDAITLSVVQYRPTESGEFFVIGLPPGTTSTTIDTGHGILTIGSTDGGRTWTWTYDLYASVTDVPGVQETDQFKVVVTDGTTEVTTDIFADIVLADDVPLAVNDGPATVAEDGASAASGNVLANDLSGGDTPKAFDSWNATANSASITELVKYGALTLNNDGSWSYVLDNSRGATQALTSGTHLSFDLAYTMKDADADTSSAILTIKVDGADDGAGVVTANTVGPDATVLEHGLTSGDDTSETTTGSFAVSASDGILNVVIGGTAFTLAEVQAFNGTQTVSTGEGVLALTGYTGNSFGGTVSYSYTLSATIDNDSKVPSGNDAVTLASFDDSLQVTVNGIGGATASDTLVVRAIDDVPAAANDGQQASVDDNASSVNIGTVAGLLGNDSFGADGQGSPGITIATGSLGGTVTISSGNLLYTSATNITSPFTPQSETFTYTINDGDGDTTTAAFTVQITDTGPSISPEGAASISVDEEGLAGGNLDGTGDLAGNAITQSGTLAGVAFGVDGTGNIVLGTSANIGFNTLAGNAIETVWNGATHTLTGQDSVTDAVVFTLQITNVSTGAYTFNLLAPVQHTVAGSEDDKTFNVTATVTDGEGESVQGTISVLIDDDTPIAQAEPAQDLHESSAINGQLDFSAGADSGRVTAVGGTAVPAAGTVSVDGQFGTLVIDAQGNYTYTADASVVGSPTETFSFTVTDRDGDPVTIQTGLTFNIQDLNTPIVNDTSVTLDEEGLGGNAGGVSGDVAGQATTFSGTLSGFNYGADGRGSGGVVLSGGPLGIFTLDGTQVVGAWDSTNSKLVGMAGATLVLDVVVDQADGDYTVTLYQPLQHAVPNTEDDVSFSVTATITDADGSTDTAALTVTIDDDTPTANADSNSGTEGAVLTGNVLTDGDDVFGADGPTVAAQGVVGVRAAGGDTTTAVQTGVNTLIAGSFGTLTLQANGSYSYDGAANVVPPAGATDIFVYTIKDGDGDLSTSTLTITLSDSGLAATNDDITVNEAALSTGSNPSSTAETAAGTLVGNVTGGTPGYTYTLTSSATGSFGTMTLNADGTYSYTLTQRFDTTPDANNGTNTENNRDTFTYQATDANGNTVSNTITVDIVDDVPLVINPQDQRMLNFAGGIITGDADTTGNMGADGLGTGTDGLVFTGALGITSNGATTFTSGGSTIYVFGYGTATLTGTTDAANADATKQVFTITLDKATDSYTFNLIKAVDNGSGFVFSDLSGVSAGQKIWDLLNPNASVNDLLVTTNAWPNPINANRVNTSSTDIGVDNQWIGSAEGLRLDFVKNLSGTETVINGFNFTDHYDVTKFSFNIQTLQGSGTTSITVSAWNAINDAHTSGSASTGTNDFLAATQVQVTIKVFNGTTDVTSSVSSVESGSGTWTLTGLQQGWRVEVTADGAPYDRLEVGYSAGQEFSLGTFALGSFDAGVARTLDFTALARDGDGDTTQGQFNVFLDPNDTTTQTFTGHTGSDKLFGGDGSDILIGGGGGDTLVGGAGSDTLTGGAGADTFDFDAATEGTDRITDFSKAAGDILDLTAIFPGAETFATLQTDQKILLDLVDADGGGSANDVRVRVDLDGAGGAAPVALVNVLNTALADLDATTIKVN